MPITERKDTREKLGPGRYACGRSFVLAGRLFRNHIECANPAYGLRELDEWEDIIRQRYGAKTGKAA